MSENIENLTNHVVAVISGASSAETAARDLRSEGFDHTRLFSGDEIAEKVDPKGQNAGLLEKVIKAAQDHLSEETNYLAQYEEEARLGNEVIAIELNDPGEAERVKTVLERHGARNIRYFGKLAVKDLTPESNPTARSAESPEPQSKT